MDKGCEAILGKGLVKYVKKRGKSGNYSKIKFHGHYLLTFILS